MNNDKKLVGRVITLLKNKFIIGLMVCLPFIALYFSGLQRSIWMGDSAEFVTVSATLGIPHPTGYPIYTWLGKLFTFLPLGEVPFRVNLMSTVFATLALFCLFLTIVELLKKNTSYIVAIISGTLAVCLLGLFRPFWRHAEFAEVYAINTFFVLTGGYLLLRWLNSKNDYYLYASFFILGISLGTHFSNIFIVPIFIVVALLAGMRKLKSFILSGASFAIGASQYIYLFFRAMQNPPYHHPQARFFGNIHHYTGPDSSILKWLWFITGGRWKGHYTKSLSGIISKSRNIFNTLLSN